MLSRLNINNVALIKNLELDFCGGLNILSGETGAGKSIIVDSLMLLLGEKYDKTILRYGEEKGYVEGVFDTTPAVFAMLEELGIESDDILIVNRKFNAEGKNEIRLNGKTVTTAMLKTVMRALVDIYGQNEYQSLTSNAEQLKIVNYFVRLKISELLKELGSDYQKYVKINKEMKSLGSLSERERNIDMLKFQIAEITKANVRENEEDELLEKRKIIASAEKIAASLSGVKEFLSDSEDSNALSAVSSAMKALGSVTSFSAVYSEIYDRLDSVSIELEDIAETISDELENVDFNENDLDKLESRLEVIRSLKRKYGAFAQMQEFKIKSQELLEKLSNSAELYEQLTLQKNQAVKKIYDISLELSAIRKAGALELEKLVEKELDELGMKGATLKVVFEELPAFEDCESHITATGFDKLEFFFSANAGQPVKPLAKVISGGEMSRFVLALKVISSRLDDISTMIFDEIDTGISGKIGQEVAKKLAIISKNHQVLCVTHLPQIASMADNHYYISKKTVDGQTLTTVGLLDNNGVIGEISRLSGAKDISAQSDSNAKEMKNWSDSYKKGL